MNNIGARKRPCGPVLSWCGVAYLIVLLLLLALNGY